jgi:HSP20 family protein
MNITKWTHKKQDPIFGELLDWDHPFFGLSMFPSLRSVNAAREGYLPAIDVKEEKDSIIVKADLPGMRKEDIDISVDGTVLTLRGERRSEKEEKDKHYYKLERSFGSFTRSIDVGAPIVEDRIKATYKDGVLEVMLPKGAPSNTKRITVE